MHKNYLTKLFKQQENKLSSLSHSDPKAVENVTSISHNASCTLVSFILPPLDNNNHFDSVALQISALNNTDANINRTISHFLHSNTTSLLECSLSAGYLYTVTSFVLANNISSAVYTSDIAIS